MLRIAILSSIFPFISADPVELVRLSHVCKTFRECLHDYGAETWELAIAQLAQNVFLRVEMSIYKQNNDDGAQNSSGSNSNSGPRRFHNAPLPNFATLRTQPTQPKIFAVPWIRLFESGSVLWVLESLRRQCPVEVAASSSDQQQQHHQKNGPMTIVTAQQLFSFEFFDSPECINLVFLRAPVCIAAAAGSLETMKFLRAVLRLPSSRDTKHRVVSLGMPTTMSRSKSNNNDDDDDDDESHTSSSYDADFTKQRDADGLTHVLSAAIKMSNDPLPIVQWLVGEKIVAYNRNTELLVPSVCRRLGASGVPDANINTEVSPIVLAAERGDVEVVRLLLSDNVRSAVEKTAVVAAISGGVIGRTGRNARFVWRQNDDERRKSSVNSNEQSDPEKQQRTSILRLLFDAASNDAYVATMLKSPFHPVLEAASSDRVNMQLQLLGNVSPNRDSPLALAARVANLSAIRFLLEKGARVDSGNLVTKQNALHAVCDRREAAPMDGSSSSSDDKNKQQQQSYQLNNADHLELMAHTIARQQKQSVSKPFSPPPKMSDENVAAAAAAAAETTPATTTNNLPPAPRQLSIEAQICELLISAGAPIDARDSAGNTPLMLAAKRGATLDVLEVLLRAGASMSIKNNDGHTASRVAQKAPLKVLYDWVAKQAM